jgi:hypothetical protein
MTDTDPARPTPQHTPGPWQHDWHFIVAPDPTAIHPDIYVAEIAEDDEEGRIASPEQREANARLIAAAPELVACVEMLWDALSDILEGIPLRDTGFEAERKTALIAIEEASALLARVFAA